VRPAFYLAKMQACSTSLSITLRQS